MHNFQVTGPNGQDWGTYDTLSNAMKRCESSGYGVVTFAHNDHAEQETTLTIKSVFLNGPNDAAMITTPFAHECEDGYQTATHIRRPSGKTREQIISERQTYGIGV